MRLVIDTSEWVHIPDRSCYNNNMYYRKANTISGAREMWILEECDESYGDGYFELYECNLYGEEKVYLGYYFSSDKPQEWGEIGTLTIEYGDCIT